MEAASFSRIGVVFLFVCGSGGASWADTSDVKGPAPVVIGKSGKHCKDDPHCFNRYHPDIKPAATAKQDQLFVLETRDALDSDLTFASTAQDVAAVNLNLVHPLTGPVYIEGAKRGDALAVTVVDIAPDDFGYTTIVPGFGFLRDVFRDPYIVRWNLTRLEARSKDLPGIAVPMNAFMGTVGVLPGKPELEKWIKREKALADAGGAALTPQPVDALPADLCGSVERQKMSASAPSLRARTAVTLIPKRLLSERPCSSLASSTDAGFLLATSIMPRAAVRLAALQSKWARR